MKCRAIRSKRVEPRIPINRIGTGNHEGRGEGSGYEGGGRMFALSVFDCFDHRFHGWPRWAAGWIVEICDICVICGCLSLRSLGALRVGRKDLAGKFEPAGPEESR